ncbi:hypothetical protein K488DRAFT_85877 [Vararia minispora EC-137]|uniref:Uncharacterized protein n=1 Tax=Vararia minispora EC-137 TaxID=1314806 RepID=A0ACB8QKP1_9AGAM|nr:hypothetical protein K488DRAFT_85877 [Vararia minispora EC-137]
MLAISLPASSTNLSKHYEGPRHHPRSAQSLDSPVISEFPQLNSKSKLSPLQTEIEIEQLPEGSGQFSAAKSLRYARSPRSNSTPSLSPYDSATSPLQLDEVYTPPYSSTGLLSQNYPPADANLRSIPFTSTGLSHYDSDYYNGARSHHAHITNYAGRFRSQGTRPEFTKASEENKYNHGQRSLSDTCSSANGEDAGHHIEHRSLLGQDLQQGSLESKGPSSQSSRFRLRPVFSFDDSDDEQTSFKLPPMRSNPPSPSSFNFRLPPKDVYRPPAFENASFSSPLCSDAPHQLSYVQATQSPPSSSDSAPFEHSLWQPPYTQSCSWKSPDLSPRFAEEPAPYSPAMPPSSQSPQSQGSALPPGEGVEHTYPGPRHAAPTSLPLMPAFSLVNDTRSPASRPELADGEKEDGLGPIRRSPGSRSLRASRFKPYSPPARTSTKPARKRRQGKSKPPGVPHVTPRDNDPPPYDLDQESFRLFSKHFWIAQGRPASFPCKWDECTEELSTKSGEMPRHFSEYHHIETGQTKRIICHWKGCGKDIMSHNLRTHILRHQRFLRGRCRHCCHTLEDDSGMQRHLKVCLRYVPAQVIMDRHSVQIVPPGPGSSLASVVLPTDESED